MWNGSRWHGSQWWGGNWWAGTSLPEGSLFAVIAGAGVLVATLTAAEQAPASSPHGGPHAIPAEVVVVWPEILLKRDDEELSVIVAAFLSVVG